MKKIGIRKINLSHEMLLLCMLIGLMVIVTSIAPVFIRIRNLNNILMQNAITGIFAMGMTMVMVSGGIDLSVGNQLSFIGCILAVMLRSGFFSPAAILLAIGLSILISFITGAIIAYTDTQPFIITLGMMSVTKALALIVTRASDVPLPPGNFVRLGRTVVLGITTPVWFFIFLFILIALIMKFTKFGRTIYAIGSNPEAAFISGIPVKKMKVLIYSINGLIVGIVSAIALSRLGSAIPTMGDGYEMSAIAACAIGGITLSGGVGSALGSFLGVLFLGVVRNGLNMMAVPTFYQYLVNGIIIVIAVVISAYRTKKGNS